MFRACRLAWLALLIPLVARAGVAPLHPKRDVLVLAVGINSYADKSLRPLNTPEREARALFDALTDPVRGLATSNDSVLLLGSQATRLAIMEALAALKGKLQRDDTLIVYWAGHSYFDVVTQEA